MPEYTPAIIRGVLDDLDTILREAVTNGTLKKTFENERYLIVRIRLLFSTFI